VDFSVVVPIYKNGETVPALLARLEFLNSRLDGRFEAVLVIDGSPDSSYELLKHSLPKAGFRSQLLSLSRNFGSFPAITAGLAAARGTHFGVMAADLQEPAELMLSFHQALAGGTCSVVLGARSARADPWPTRFFSSLFWRAYRSLVQKDVPPGGVDVFACDLEFRDSLLACRERNTTLIGLIFWLGFPRMVIEYERLSRPSGKSAWTWSRKVRYFLDSAFAFSDLPIRLISGAGVLGLLLSMTLGAVVVVARLWGAIPVPGYAATVITVMFFGGLNSLGIGLLGEYLWRAFENTKGRPLFVVARRESFGEARSGPSGEGSHPDA
jgi:glycosyltransferase involved in cell wall biosynthesis